MAFVTDLATFIDEDEFNGIIGTFGDRGDLCRNPGEVFILEPHAGSFVVDVLGHGPRWTVALVLFGGRKCKKTVQIY
jgi:hypothetical protein